MPSSITVVGLGPGEPSLLTVEAHDILASAPEVWLRTTRHPAVSGLPPGPRYGSFDDMYEREASFDAVYRTIVERVLDLGRRPDGVVYAVPGHPLFGEATVRSLMIRAPEEGIAVRIVSGVSFIDTVATTLGLDPLTDGLLVLDALALGDSRVLVPQRPTIIAQVYDRRAASQAKLALLDAYPPGHIVRVVKASGTRSPTVSETPIAQLDHADAFDHLVSLYITPLAPIEDVRSFEGLRRVVARLRSPEDGCLWDLEQTHQTLKRYLLEEAYEALDALDEGDPHRLSEELGDLLMQVVLHAQVAEDGDNFTIEDVVSSIATKLIRRHPHVFGDLTVTGSGDVIRNWEALKQTERGDAPVLDAIPLAMPALAQAQSLQGRSLRAGLYLPGDPMIALRRIADEIARSGDLDALRLGELLFEIVALARARGLDAEEALRMTVRRFRDEVAARERESRAG